MRVYLYGLATYAVGILVSPLISISAEWGLVVGVIVGAVASPIGFRIQERLERGTSER